MKFLSGVSYASLQRFRPLIDTIVAAAIGGAIGGVLDALAMQREGFTIVNWEHLRQSAIVGAMIAVAGLWKRKPTDTTKIETAKEIIATDAAKEEARTSEQTQFPSSIST